MWLILLQAKSEAAEAVKRIKARAEAECEKKMRVLRTDRGGEFTSVSFSKYCDEIGIQRNLTAPIPAGAENPSLSRLCYQRLWGSRNRRALILGWAYYFDAFSSYPLHTWLPSVYRGHDNWYTRGASFPVLSY